jgi:hypothetical protein
MPLLPFIEALALQRGRVTFPTSLGSRELRELDAVVRRQANFSARTTLTRLLDGYSETIERLIGNEINPADARVAIKELQQRMGLRADGGDTGGGITDLLSDARIDFKIQTDTELMQGFGQMVQGQSEGALDEFPAQELYRLEDRKEERDWGQTANGRWLAACRAAGDAAAVDVWQRTGRMVARKDSRVWDELGNGAGGYEDDSLGNPYPPFAFSSGMWTEDVQRDEAIELGLITEDEQVAARDLGTLVPNIELEAAA